MIRAQTILVLLLVLIVLAWGTRSVVSGDPGGDPTVAIETTALAALPSPTSRPAPTHAPTIVVGFEPTSVSSPSPESTTESTPVPTEKPNATERPTPPDTGQEQSLIIDRGDSGRLEVAFSFDAGEGAGHTAEILDLMAGYGIHGTFGVTGQWAEQNPDLLRRIVDEGHQVINHTYDHQSFTGVSPGTDELTDAERRDEVEKTEGIIADITGGYQTSPFFRFPYGDYDGDALDLLGDLGFSYTMWWSCDTQGWNGFTPDEIVDLCGTTADKGGPGAILLMHVAQENDWEALEPLIEDYQAAGYSFVTLEELVQP